MSWWEFWRAMGLCSYLTATVLLWWVWSPRYCSWFSSHTQSARLYTNDSTGYLLPVNAIHRAYFVASLRQWEATSNPHVTVSEMIPMMMKNRVVTHSGGSRGGMQVRSRPWIVWHCRTRPTVSAPGGDAKSGDVLVGLHSEGIFPTNTPSVLTRISLYGSHLST